VSDYGNRRTARLCDRATSTSLPLNGKGLFHRHNYTLLSPFHPLLDSNNTDGLGYASCPTHITIRDKKKKTKNRGKAEKSKVIKRFKKRACTQKGTVSEERDQWRGEARGRPDLDGDRLVCNERLLILEV